MLQGGSLPVRLQHQGKEGTLSPALIASQSCRKLWRGAEPQLTASGLPLQPCGQVTPLPSPGGSGRRRETQSLELSGNWGSYL